jgi:hypothetical protein
MTGVAQVDAVSQLPSGWMLALIMTTISLLAHEPWRWIGMFLGRNIDIQSEIFRWVRAVSTALVAALVMRLLIFPAGALQTVPLGVRVLGMAGGLAAFMVGGRRISHGVMVAAVVLVALQLATG